MHKKSTLAKELSEILNVPCIHLDKVFWKPNWGETDPDEFQGRLAEILDSDDCARGWVVDGNYSGRVGNILESRLTDIICSWITVFHLPERVLICHETLTLTGLDPPFLLYFPRLVKRTFQRVLGTGPPCAPGCEESFSNVFLSRDSIIWWCITHHIPVKKKQSERMQTRGIDVGGNMRRIGGWGTELAEWKQSVADLVKNDIDTPK